MIVGICESRRKKQDEREKENVDGSHASIPSLTSSSEKLPNRERWFLGLP